MFSKIFFKNDTLDNTVIATIQLIKTMNIEIAASEIKRKLQWSPSYPSINSIQSFLKQWNVDSIVMTVDKANIDKLPPVFLCHLQNEKESFRIVTKHDNASVQWLNNNDEPISVPMNEFLKKWSGIILLAEKNENSGMPDYKNVRMMDWWERNFIPSIIFTLFISTIAKALVNSNDDIATSVASIFLQLLAISGILICFFLVRYLIDDSDDAIKKLCTAGKNANDCTKIINAVDAKVFGFSWAEIGLTWFLGAGLCISTTGLNTALGLFSIAAVAFIPYSIYYQTKIAKQCCVICLYILGIIIIHAAIYLYLFEANALTISIATFFQNLFAVICCMLAPAICWFAIKRFVFNRKALLLAEQGYYRLKHNPKVYDLLQNNSPAADTTAGSPVSFNIAANDFEITMISSLSCAPCGEAHQLLEKVISNNPDVCFKLYILPLKDPLYHTLQHLKILLTILEEEGSISFLAALHYWYHTANRDYIKFIKKYPERNISAAVEYKIIKMGHWISEHEITTTPNYLVNGKMMPDIYGVEDILAMVANL